MALAKTLTIKELIKLKFHSKISLIECDKQFYKVYKVRKIEVCQFHSPHQSLSWSCVLFLLNILIIAFTYFK